TLKWMGSDSKKHANAKLDNMHIKIGFPDKWKDYTDLSINSDDLIGNVIHIKDFNYNQDLDTLGKPVDKSKWYKPPQMVNAYY
ncbi:M13 family peptidase, partial [Francisella tularensis subsp. holarctica]|nr:M13 family peptidase [Francisella tularensis subsp. holarctica]